MKSMFLMVSLCFLCVMNSYGQERYGVAAAVSKTDKEYDNEHIKDVIKYCYLIDGDNYILYDVNIPYEGFIIKGDLSELRMKIKNQEYVIKVDKYIEGEDSDYIYSTDKDVWIKYINSDDDVIFFAREKKFFLTQNEMVK